MNRLADFYIGVSEQQPSSLVDVPPTYPVCAYHSGMLVDSARECVSCSSSITGRYVTIQLTNTVTALTLCEVEVYGGRAAATLLLFGKNQCLSVGIKPHVEHSSRRRKFILETELVVNIRCPVVPTKRRHFASEILSSLSYGLYC